jgi:hypothetical protein
MGYPSKGACNAKLAKQASKQVEQNKQAIPNLKALKAFK